MTFFYYTEVLYTSLFISFTLENIVLNLTNKCAGAVQITNSDGTGPVCHDDTWGKTASFSFHTLINNPSPERNFFNVKPLATTAHTVHALHYCAFLL